MSDKSPDLDRELDWQRGNPCAPFSAPFSAPGSEIERVEGLLATADSVWRERCAAAHRETRAYRECAQTMDRALRVLEQAIHTISCLTETEVLAEDANPFPGEL